MISKQLIRLNFLNNFTRILTTKKANDVIEIIDKNLTIDKSIPKLINMSAKKSTFVAK